MTAAVIIRRVFLVFSGALIAVGHRAWAIGATVDEGWFTAKELEGES